MHYCSCPTVRDCPAVYPALLKWKGCMLFISENNIKFGRLLLLNELNKRPQFGLILKSCVCSLKWAQVEVISSIRLEDMSLQTWGWWTKIFSLICIIFCYSWGALIFFKIPLSYENHLSTCRGWDFNQKIGTGSIFQIGPSYTTSSNSRHILEFLFNLLNDDRQIKIAPSKNNREKVDLALKIGVFSVFCLHLPVQSSNLSFSIQKPSHVTNIYWKFQDFLPSSLGVIKVLHFTLQSKDGV